MKLNECRGPRDVPGAVCPRCGRWTTHPWACADCEPLRADRVYLKAWAPLQVGERR